jgi:hypothetical protein
MNDWVAGRRRDAEQYGRFRAAGPSSGGRIRGIEIG